MEDELKCVWCNNFYVQPVLLPCCHAMCLRCAIAASNKQQQQQPFVVPINGKSSSFVIVHSSAQHQHSINDCSSSSGSSSGGGGSSSASSVDQSDQLSTLSSETDSGVSVANSCNSGNTTTTTSTAAAAAYCYYSLCCPFASCAKMVYFDENGAHNLPRYKAMETIVGKFINGSSSSKSSKSPLSSASSSPSVQQQQQQQFCQLCPPPPHQSQNERGDDDDGSLSSSPSTATVVVVASVYCQQCQVFYCDRCRESCHPMRGPLAKHNLMTLSAAAAAAAVNVVGRIAGGGHQSAAITDHNDARRRMSSSSSSSSNATTVRERQEQEQREEEEDRCSQHVDQPQTYYCNTCKVGACHLCLLQGRRQQQQQSRQHDNHDVQLIAVICKRQKAELTQSLQQLSEKAKRASEAIQRLKSSSEHVQESCVQVESAIRTRCAELMDALERRQGALIEFARRERDVQLRRLRDEVSACTAHLQSTTALVQFCIAALKEADSSQAAFLQIGAMLVERVSNLHSTWSLHQSRSMQQQETEVEEEEEEEEEEQEEQEAPSCSRRLSNGGAAAPAASSCRLQLTLDDLGLRRSIDQLTFLEMKPPGAPQIVADECSAENNSVTVSWRLPPHPAAATSSAASTFVEGFILELDDGCGGGRFREVYRGKEDVCTVEGLHFNSLYNARVKAFNSSGHGPYSQLLSLHTAQVAWFTFDDDADDGGDGDGRDTTAAAAAAAETRLSADALTATTDSYEPRVLLGSVGFSRGVHYWEFTVDRYDNGTAMDPAFGIARRNVTRDAMLGKDELGWSMYIDHRRSWLLHGNVHSDRTEGGIAEGSTVGVLLDLEQRQLSFYVNDDLRQGSTLTEVLNLLIDGSGGGGGVFYPAVSLNRNVQVTLHSALDPPLASSAVAFDAKQQQSLTTTSTTTTVDDECH